MGKFLIISFLMVSCASTKKEVVANNDLELRIQEHLIDKELGHCNNCIVGALGDEGLKNADKKIYFLHGAEHLNLSNNYFDIPVVYNAATKKWIDYFTTRGREHYQRYAQRAGRYAPVLSKILNDQQMPRDLIFLSMAESGFSNVARSWAKAVGPWQFMPYTGRQYGLNIDFYLDERRDPLKSTIAASNYLKDLYELFGSWELAMASYNAGEGKIKRAIKIYKTDNFWDIRKGRYLKAETKEYVPKIMALAIISKNLKHFGFTEINFEKTLDYEEIIVSGNTDLYRVGDVLGLDFDLMKKYNPEVLRWQVSPNIETYTLRVPVGMKNKWDKFEEKEYTLAQDYMDYQLRGYASLFHVARKFKLPKEVLAQLNEMDPDKRMPPKTTVLLPFRKTHTPNKNHLYADLYEQPRKSIIRRRVYNQWLSRGKRLGKRIENPKQFYIVKKGDTLWDIARKNEVDVNTIIHTNYELIKKRMILPGDKLAIR